MVIVIVCAGVIYCRIALVADSVCITIVASVIRNGVTAVVAEVIGIVSVRVSTKELVTSVVAIVVGVFILANAHFRIADVASVILLRIHVRS